MLDGDQWLRLSVEAHKINRTYDDPLKTLKKGMVFLLAGSATGYIAVIDRETLLPLCSIKVSSDGHLETVL